MAAAVGDEREWETQAEIDACLREIGMTSDQVIRWRREGLLPQVEQVPDAYRGSTVRYPIGTCAQIRAAQALFREKNRNAFVGLRLWRLGFPVREDYWRPRLKRFGLRADRVLWFINRLAARFDREDHGETLQERAARHPASNIILSRIRRRLNLDERGAFLRVIIEIGTGKFDGFEPPIPGEPRHDEDATIKAFDFGAAERHKILGQSLNLIGVLPSALNNAAIAFSMGSFEQAANLPGDVIAGARNDATNALAVGLSLYDGLKWIYGDEAFGLRFIAWFVRKAPDAVIDGMILPMLRLRNVPDAILSSEKIAALTVQARALKEMSMQMERLWREDPRYKIVFDPKRIRAAFADEISAKRWRDEVKAVSISSESVGFRGEFHGGVSTG